MKDSGERNDFFLPEKLKVYAKSNFAIQQKARVFYNICIAAIIGLTLLVFSSVYVQLTGSYGKLVPEIIIPELILILVFFYCIRLLVKGSYNFASHFFMISANITVWYVMWVSKSDFITQIDTVVILLALINIIPLFIINYRWSVYMYVVFNLLILFLFVYANRNYPGIGKSIWVDYIIDTSIALIFSGIAAYQIIKINNRSLERVELDYKERIKAENELKDSEFRYKVLFENAQVGIYQTTPDGKILRANPALIKILGYDSFEDLSKRDLNKDESYVKITRNNFIHLIEKQGFVKDFETEWKKKNGEIVFIKENSRAVRDETGKTLYYEGFISDITDQKRTLQALKESEEKYRSLMESINEVIIVADNDHVVKYVNSKFTEKLGYTPEEIIGKIGFKILHDPNDYHLIENANKERIQKKQTHYELPFIAKDGRKIYFLVSGAPVLDEAGNTIASIGAMVDINDRKIAEKALSESEKKFRDMADLLPVAIWEADLAGNITYTNKIGYELTGYRQDDLGRGINIMSLIIEEDRNRAAENLKQRLHGADLPGIEYTCLRKNGLLFPIRIYTSIIYKDKKTVGLRGAIVDITNAKEAEKELKESEEKYRTLMENLNDVIMMVDNEDRVLFVNKKFTEKLGYTQNEIEGKIGYEILVEKKHQDIIKKENQDRIEKNQVVMKCSLFQNMAKRLIFL